MRRAADRRRSRRTRASGIVVVGTLLVVTGCGLPGGDDARVVDPDTVPYRLLEGAPGPQQTDRREEPAPALTPVVFWLTGADLLAPSSSDASCTAPTEEVVADLLSDLTTSPDQAASAAGRSSAVPPSSRLELLGVADGVAVVGLEASTSLAADRLPLAVGQLVLTVTSAPGVDSVRVSTAGHLVEVPLPGGALTSRPVTSDDYASLVPARYRASGGPGRVLDDIGCPAGTAGDPDR